MIENEGFIKDESRFVIFPIMVLGLFLILKYIDTSSEIMLFLSFIIVCILIVIYIFKFIKSKLSERDKEEKKCDSILNSVKISNQLIGLFFCYYLLKNIFREFETIFSGVFIIILFFIIIKSELINKNKQRIVNDLIKNNHKLLKKEIIKIYVKKEFIKIVLIGFISISPMIFNLLVVWYGSLSEYLNHNILRLFTDIYYIQIAFDYGHPMNVYFQYIKGHLQISNLYLWLIPFVMSIIHVYISYWLIHKIVDRSGIGATQKLNFFHFFFICGISNILARIICYGTTESNGINFLSVTFVGYTIYKIIKIGVLKIEEKSKKQGE